MPLSHPVLFSFFVPRTLTAELRIFCRQGDCGMAQYYEAIISSATGYSVSGLWSAKECWTEKTVFIPSRRDPAAHALAVPEKTLLFGFGFYYIRPEGSFRAVSEKSL